MKDACCAALVAATAALPGVSNMSKRIGVAGRPQRVCLQNGGRRSLLVVAIAACLPATAQQVTLLPYDPVNNSAQQGAVIVQSGASLTVTGPQLFASGDSGERQTTIADLKNSGGRLDVSGLQWLSAARLNPGTQNFGVSVPDPITGGRRVASAYNTTNLVDLPPFPDNTSVPDIANVGQNQYIDARIGTVQSTGGTLDIAIGTPGAASTASTNGWTMAAKQTSLVYIDGTSTDPTAAPSVGNWTSTNRITFNGAVASPDETQNFNVNYVSHYAGALNVTIGGTAYAFTVNDPASLRAYNDFLIARMQAGDLDPAQYNVYFALAYTYSTETVTYKLSATAPAGDKIAEPIGDRIVLHAVGANASGNIAQGATLEVVNANNGAVRGEQGAHVSIAQGGTLATTHTSGDGSAIILVSASHGTNDGVINGNFFRDPSTGAITDGAFGSNVVDVQSGSDFTNNGILNLATGTTNGAGKSTGIRLGAGATGTNDGIVNVGVSGSRSNGSMDGIYLNDPTATFTNALKGSIYIGRGPQVDPATPAADVAINQGTLTTGINVANGGKVTNDGNITIGTLTQNAAAIYVTSPVANVANTGTIDIKGKAAAVPRENDGILVQNGGASGNVVNSGTINVSGVNGVGIKALSTAGTPSAVRTTGIINVVGDADPASGTRNFGVWAEGQGSAIAHADVQGAVNLSGNGAIGIHARGRATVDVAAGAAPSFANGTNQIGFFAFGDNAHINVNSGSILDVSTTKSTLFRLDSGADFDGTGLVMKVSGPQAVGVLGSGTGSVLNTRDASIAVSGAGAQGVIAEGGAKATIDAATTMTLTGNGAIAGIADGQKHSLAGANTGSLVRSTSLTSLATLASSQAGVIGFIARNGASLANSGDIAFTGAGTTGFIVETNASASNAAKVDLSGPGATGALLRSGGTFANNGTIHVGNGTGVRVEGAGTQRLNPAGTISVDDGVAGVQLVAGAGLVLGSGDSAIVTRGSAHGVLLDTGAVSLVAKGTTITTLGTGNAIENAAEVAAITLTGATLRVGDGAGLRTATAIDPASTATIDVEGAGVGYAFRHADGSPATADFVIGQGFTVNGNAAGSRGIQALTTGAVTSAATVNILDAAGGAALIAGTASSVANSGQLTSASVVAPVVDIANGQGTSFTNTGVVSAASPQTLAVQGTGHSVVNLVSGGVRGDIATSGAGSALRWTGGTLDGGASLGDGGGNTAYLGAVDTSHTYHLLAAGGSGNVLTFDGTQARGGSFAADDLSKGVRVVGWNIFALSNAATFELTDNLRMAGSEVVIDKAATLYAGNGVHPVISADADPVIVNNAGTIDLTNGSGSPGNILTVAGQYAGMVGRLNLATTLNQGGALTDQFTDRLLVQGDASGTTSIRITPSAASTGALTDLDRNGYVGPAEGISLVQVAGASTGDAFRIAGGYVAFGPWQYGLYTFAPGASDASQRQVSGSGNGFWDYRLANVLVCEGGPCPQPQVTTPDTPPPVAVTARPAVVPQLPAYVVSPSALALYGYRTIDNLHRRLGEVRQMDDMDAGLGGEPFARVMGGDYAYRSNRSFQDYGFDADIDMRAVQVGTDILDLQSDRNSLRAGVAYTHGTTRVDPKVADGYSHAKIDSNSLAMTLTWQHANGFYLDAIVSGDRHAGDVDTARAKGAARLTGTGWSASLESGYPFVLGQGWGLEPQLQMVRQHIGMRDQVDSDGVTTRYRPFDQSIGRAGLRLDRTWRTDNGSAFTPYARLNYIRGWGGAPHVVVGAQGYDLAQAFTGGTFGRMWELGLGGTWQWRDRLSLYGEGDWQGRAGSNGAQGWSANLGVRWNF